MKRKLVIPGEVIAEGENYLPGNGSERKGSKIYSLKYGLLEESNNLVRVIPLSGTYQPKRGNVVIGIIKDITFNGWVVDIGSPEKAFLSLSEFPGYINKNRLEEVLDIGDIIVTKIWALNKRGVDLTMKSKGLTRIDRGILVKINSNRVPRVIGKEGSMIKLIKERTGCNIQVGQNGLIWIRGKDIEDELYAKKIILFVNQRSFTDGLTEEVKDWFDKNKNIKNN